MEPDKETTQEEVVEEVKEEVVVEESEVKTEETVEEEVVETEREKNLKAEARRKQEEVIRLREENERLREHQPVTEEVNVDKQLRRMSDRELESYLNNAQYSNLHISIKEILDERRFDRYTAKKDAERVKLDAEIAIEQKYPEVLNPSHPMALRTKELIRQYRLESNPQGRLIAAELAASEFGKKKAVAAGRKQEQDRQADVKANFQGDSARQAPKVSDKVKVEELKKRALQGDETARREWMAYRMKMGL